MNKNVALLSIGATLSLSLFIVDLGHAVHIDRTGQYAHTRMAADITEPANPPPIQVSNAPNFCKGDGMRRSGAPCMGPSSPGPGDRAIDGIVYTRVAITATLILTLVVLLCLVSLSRRISQPPWVKSTQ
jgi:hypothetical protein